MNALPSNLHSVLTLKDLTVQESRSINNEMINCNNEMLKMGEDKVFHGTNIFVSFVHAIRYYECYGFTASDVSKKIEDGSIQIGVPVNKNGHWDEDFRWVEERKSDRLAFLERQFSDLFYQKQEKEHLYYALCELANDLPRRDNGVQFSISPKSKTALDRELRKILSENWTEKLPYSTGGRPLYSFQEYQTEFLKTNNNRIITINWKGKTFVVLFFRNIVGPGQDVWGMMDGYHKYIFIDGDQAQYFFRRSHLIKRIMETA